MGFFVSLDETFNKSSINFLRDINILIGYPSTFELSREKTHVADNFRLILIYYFRNYYSIRTSIPIGLRRLIWVDTLRRDHNVVFFVEWLNYSFSSNVLDNLQHIYIKSNIFHHGLPSSLMMLFIRTQFKTLRT